MGYHSRHYSKYDLFLVWVPRKKYVPFFVSTTATSVSPAWSVMRACACGVTWRTSARHPWDGRTLEVQTMKKTNAAANATQPTRTTRGLTGLLLCSLLMRLVP